MRKESVFHHYLIRQLLNVFDQFLARALTLDHNIIQYIREDMDRRLCFVLR